jgi:hypothetical protein
MPVPIRLARPTDVETVRQRRERDALGTSWIALAPQVVFVVVSGPPASGKSTLAPALACEQALPLIVKDAMAWPVLEVYTNPISRCTDTN